MDRRQGMAGASDGRVTLLLRSALVYCNICSCVGWSEFRKELPFWWCRLSGENSRGKVQNVCGDSWVMSPTRVGILTTYRTRVALKSHCKERLVTLIGQLMDRRVFEILRPPAGVSEGSTCRSDCTTLGPPKTERSIFRTVRGEETVARYLHQT
jgi:hypothetical protein